jgi:hypothetical protein
MVVRLVDGQCVIIHHRVKLIASASVHYFQIGLTAVARAVPAAIPPPDRPVRIIGNPVDPLLLISNKKRCACDAGK